MLINNTCAVVVFYNPEEIFFANVLNTTLKEVGEVVVVFNEYKLELDNLVIKYFQNPKIHLIKNAKNLGIASAMNQGVTMAENLGYEWVLLLDQDSSLEKSYLNKMEAGFLEITKKLDERLIGGIFPKLYQTAINKFFTKNPTTNSFFENYDPITSGCVLNIKIFNEIGKLDAGLFLYHVDTDYNLRLKNSKYKMFEISSAILNHREGSFQKYTVFGREFISVNHSFLATYYLSRNEIFMIQRYWLSNPDWSLNSIIWYFKYAIKSLIFEKNKISKIKAIFSGLVDGLMGKYGIKN